MLKILGDRDVTLSARKPPALYLISGAIALGIMLRTPVPLIVAFLYAFFFARILMDATVFVPKLVTIANNQLEKLSLPEEKSSRSQMVLALWRSVVTGSGVRLDIFLGLPIILACQIYIFAINLPLANSQGNEMIFGGLVALLTFCISSAIYVFATLLKPYMIINQEFTEDTANIIQ